MSSLFDRSFAPVDAAMGAVHGESVEYTFLDGRSVTDTKAFVDHIPSGYEVDEGIRTSQDQQNGNEAGITYNSRRTFGLRKSVIGADDPEISARVRVVSEVTSKGVNAAVWSVWRVIGAEHGRWYVECERVEDHERGRGSFRSRG